MEERELGGCVVPPPAELTDTPDGFAAGGSPFFPGRDRDDPEVVAAVAKFRRRIAEWCEARAAWAAANGWPGGEAERLAEEYGEGWDPTEI